MSFPRYEAYKESGIDWLGEVPKLWNVSRLKRIFSVVSGSTPKSDNETLWEGGIPWVTPADLSQTSSRYISQTTRTISKAGLASCGTTLVPSGSIVVSTRAPIGSIAIAAMTLCTNQGCRSLVPIHNCSTSFFFFTLLSAVRELNIRGKGTTFLELSADELASFIVPVPSPAEQSEIAAFLDRETAKIDALVQEQQRLIELLKEKRQAVISHAVTKGLNPDAPMKDSGVEWLGEVPEHWKIFQVGQLCSYLSYGFTNPMPTSDDGPFMLTANDIDYGSILYDSARHTTYSAFTDLLTNKSRPKEGDLLLTKDGTLGRIAIHDGQEACINQSVALLRPDANTVTSEFLWSALMGGVYQDRMIFEAGGTTIKHIYISRLAKMALAVPPLSEQSDIYERLREKLSRQDALVNQAEAAITLLQERRSALISAAVTGKIDVRGLASVKAEAA